MTDARLAVAFTAGMLATVNPCALPMLPAYLGWFITGDDDDTPTGPAVARAVVVALAVSVGFMAVFGLLGLLATAASAQVEEITPWITPVVGLALVGLGLALALGRSVRIPVPRPGGARSGRGLATMVTYGASYAVVSVSCTLGVFLIHVSTTFGEGWGVGLTQMAAFGAGFSLVLVALSVSVALARGSLTGLVRRAAPYVDRVAGVLLVVTGAYLVWYGIAEIRLASTGPTSDPVIDRVTGWSGDISAAVHDVGGTEVGLILALFVAIVALVVVVRSGGRRPGSDRASR